MALLKPTHLPFGQAVLVFVAVGLTFTLSDLCLSFLRFDGLSGCFHFTHFYCLVHNYPLVFPKWQSLDLGFFCCLIVARLSFLFRLVSCSFFLFALQTNFHLPIYHPIHSFRFIALLSLNSISNFSFIFIYFSSNFFHQNFCFFANFKNRNFNSLFHWDLLMKKNAGHPCYLD